MTHRVQPRHAAPTRSTRDRLDRLAARLPRSRRIASAGAIAAGMAALCLTPLGASAATAGAHDPFGYLDQASSAASAIKVQGWAADPDTLSRSLEITFTIDAKAAGQVLSAVPRPDASAARGAGPKAGFAATLAAKPGSHLVCATAVNLAAGGNHQLGCLSVTVADPAAAHNPIGAVEHASVAGTAVTVTGWAADPDSLSQPLKISATVDAKPAKLTKSAVQARPDIAKSRHSGPNQGYLLITTVTGNGLHTVCVIAANLAAGANSQLGCTSIRIGPPPPTAAQIAAQSPSGALEKAAAESATRVRVTGWASDPDNRATPLQVVGYVDGTAARTVEAGIGRSDLVASKKAGLRSGYSFWMPASTGPHNVCVWAVNIGIGTNKFLGCLSLSTPSTAMPAGPTPATPASNKKVTTLAAKYLGAKYVWGGEDPKTGFDCSGLVQYTYRLAAGINTPRVAQDQFSAARMITAGRAVPGDLVFFHDSLGSVYHVGIFAGAGRMYAAVDEAEGVRYQQIWDPTATYGSFTHS